MALADDLLGDLADLLDNPDYGRAATLRKYTPGAYDPATGASAAASSTTQAVRVILLNYSDRFIAAGLAAVGDRKAIIKAKNLTFAPENGQQLVVGADTYTIVSLKPIELAGTVVSYTAQVRKGAAT